MRARKSEIAWVFGGRAVAAIGALASIKIITQYLSVADMGVFGFALAIANGTSRFAFAPLSQPMLRFSGSAAAEGDFASLLASFVRAFAMMLILVAIVATVIALIGIDVLGSTQLLLAVLIACCIGLQSANFSMMSSMRWRRSTAFSHVFVAWGRGLLAIPLMIIFGARPEVALIGYLAALILCILWQTRTILRGTNLSLFTATRPDTTEWKTFTAYAAPFFVMFGIDAASQEIDKVIVAAYFTNVELGAYVAMQLLARMPVFFVVGLVEQIVYPIFFQGSRKADGTSLTLGAFQRIIPLYLVIVAALGTLCLLVYIFREPLVGLLTTADYVPYAVLLPSLMLAGVIAQSARILQAPALRAIGSRVFIPAKICQLVVLIVGMFISIPAFGLYGVAVAANIAAVALIIAIAVTNAYYLRRKALERDSDDE